jgi:hypothetical protein
MPVRRRGSVRPRGVARRQVHLLLWSIRRRALSLLRVMNRLTNGRHRLRNL